MNPRLRKFACAASLALAAVAGHAAANTEPCGKNHYILDQPADCGWTRTSDLKAERHGHTATALADGRVLVVGGTANLEDSVEIYDPQSKSWQVAAPLSRPRGGHLAVLLLDGRVLVVGGDAKGRDARGWVTGYEGTAEIFDPATGSWTPAPGLAAPRWAKSATATRLADGRVLVAGGEDDNYACIFVAELFDPQTLAWTLAGQLTSPRCFGNSAALLADGRVLVAGGVEDDFFGDTQREAETFDPATGRWTASPDIRFDRGGHTTLALPDGRMLVAGGWYSRVPRDGGYTEFGATAPLEIFDPRTDEWLPAGELSVPRFHHTATLLADGTVLIAGGMKPKGTVPAVTYETLAHAELFPGSDGGPSMAASSLHEARFGHTATPLRDGSVLVVGGTGAGKKGPLKSAEIYRPWTAP